jgi:hypothetical protein
VTLPRNCAHELLKSPLYGDCHIIISKVLSTVTLPCNCAHELLKSPLYGDCHITISKGFSIVTSRNKYTRTLTLQFFFFVIRKSGTERNHRITPHVLCRRAPHVARRRDCFAWSSFYFYFFLYSADVHRMCRAGETTLHGLFSLSIFLFLYSADVQDLSLAGETALHGLVSFFPLYIYIYSIA